MTNQPKQKTAIRQLIDKCKVRIREISVDSLHHGHRATENSLKINGLLEAIEFAESLEPVNEQHIIDANNDGYDSGYDLRNNEYNAGQQYFNETFEKP